MECNRIQERAADWLSNGLIGEEKEEFAGHLNACAACRKETEEMKALWEKMDTALDAELRPEAGRRFASMLEAYAHSLTAHRQENKAASPDRFAGARRPFFLAAAAILIFALGMVLGHGMEHGKLRDMEVSALRQEMARMHEMVTVSLLTQSSAIDRLQGITMSGEIKIPDNRLLEALIRTLDTDPNVNVRMAAVDALGRYSDRAEVQNALVDALGRQNSPLVQVSLIDLLVALQVPGAKDALQTLIEQKDRLEPVKARARAGLKKLI